MQQRTGGQSPNQQRMHGHWNRQRSRVPTGASDEPAVAGPLSRFATSVLPSPARNRGTRDVTFHGPDRLGCRRWIPSRDGAPSRLPKVLRRAIGAGARSFRACIGTYGRRRRRPTDPAEAADRRCRVANLARTGDCNKRPTRRLLTIPRRQGRPLAGSERMQSRALLAAGACPRRTSTTARLRSEGTPPQIPAYPRLPRVLDEVVGWHVSRPMADPHDRRP